MNWCGHLATFVVALLLAGCGKPSAGPMIVVPGQGITKIAELGMSLSEIQDAVSDLKTRAYPETGFPWQKDIVGERRRLPWEKPSEYMAVSQSLGLCFSAPDKKKPVQALIFFTDPDPIPVNSNVWFTGQLSCGISFANRRRVSREEIVAKFGEASVHGVDLDSNLDPLLRDGVSVSNKSGTGNGVENLYYPTNGIWFCLQHDLVIAFDIRQKITKPETER